MRCLLINQRRQEFSISLEALVVFGNIPYPSTSKTLVGEPRNVPSYYTHVGDGLMSEACRMHLVEPSSSCISQILKDYCQKQTGDLWKQ